MEESQAPLVGSYFQEATSSHLRNTVNGRGRNNYGGVGVLGFKKRGHGLGSRSWIKIDKSGNSKILELDKNTIMKHCSLPSRDLRLLDPLFIYPSTILGREKAIVVSLEQIRCIITADEVILMNSLDASVVQYKSELCQRLQMNKDQSAPLKLIFGGKPVAACSWGTQIVV